MIDTDTIGRISLFQPKGRPNGLVFLLSDLRGWSSELTWLAKHLREHGLIVAGVDSRKLVARLDAGDRQCLSLLGAFETTSQRIQHDARLDVYFLPVLAGIGASLGAVPATVEPDLSPPRQLARLFDWSSEERARDTADALKLGDLAVIELAGRPGSDTAAIILSGDGGWRDLDRSLGEILATSGVHVIGIDCLRYYWNRKPPETTAADLERLIVELGTRTGIRYIALIGYSFGADVLPFIYNRLSPQVRERVVLLSLLAPGRDAHFEIQVAGWLGVDASNDATPIAPELAKIDPSLVQCVYGEEEAAESSCRDAVPQPGEIIGIPGGHHFDEDYPALAQRILRRLTVGIRHT